LNLIKKYNQRKIWFKRWTNKGWGIFFSLNAVVHILKVKHSICRQAMLKQAGALKKSILKTFGIEKILSILILQKEDAPPVDILFYLNSLIISEDKLVEETSVSAVSSQGYICPA